MKIIKLDKNKIFFAAILPLCALGIFFSSVSPTLAACNGNDVHVYGEACDSNLNIPGYCRSGHPCYRRGDACCTNANAWFSASTWQSDCSNAYNYGNGINPTEVQCCSNSDCSNGYSCRSHSCVKDPSNYFVSDEACNSNLSAGGCTWGKPCLRRCSAWCSNPGAWCNASAWTSSCTNPDYRYPSNALNPTQVACCSNSDCSSGYACNTQNHTCEQSCTASTPCDATKVENGVTKWCRNMNSGGYRWTSIAEVPCTKDNVCDTYQCGGKKGYCGVVGGNSFNWVESLSNSCPYYINFSRSASQYYIGMPVWAKLKTNIPHEASSIYAVRSAPGTHYDGSKSYMDSPICGISSDGYETTYSLFVRPDTGAPDNIVVGADQCNPGGDFPAGNYVDTYSLGPGSNGKLKTTDSFTINCSGQCQGVAPNGTTQIKCPNESNPSDNSQSWINVGNSSASCTGGKCEYYSYSCGNLPGGAIMCPDTSNPPNNSTFWHEVSTCTSGKCEYYMPSGYTCNDPDCTGRCGTQRKVCSPLGTYVCSGTECGTINCNGCTTNKEWKEVAP